MMPFPNSSVAAAFRFMAATDSITFSTAVGVLGEAGEHGEAVALGIQMMSIVNVQSLCALPM